MNLTVSIYQRRTSEGLRWVTLGLGSHTVRREGSKSPRLQKKLLDELRSAVGEMPASDLVLFQPRRGLRLERVRVELTLPAPGGRRKLAGVFPLVLEERDLGPDGEMTIAYHPEWQDDWFPADTDAPLDDQASAFLSRVFAPLPDETINPLRSDGRDLVKSFSFTASPETLLDRFSQKKGPFDDLEPVDPRRKKRKKKKRGTTRILGRLGFNLTLQMLEETSDPGVRREPFSSQLMLLLGAARKTPVLLVGQSGCGRRSLMRRFAADLARADGWDAHRSLEKLQEIWSVSSQRLIAGMSYVGDWQQRCLEVLEDLRGSRRILLVEDLHAFGRVGRTRDSDANLAMFFQGPVSRGDAPLAGFCTPEQLARLEEDAPSFASLFTRLHLPDATREEALRLVIREARSLELKHRVHFVPSALSEVLDHATTLFSASALPGSAIDLLRDVAREHEGDSSSRVSPTEVALTVSGRTGLSDTFTENLRLEPAEVDEELSLQVMGQPEALRAAVDQVLRIHAGLNDPRRPWGVMLFTGPTGTGKTELAKALASYLFGDPARLLRFDMGEFQDPGAAGRLAGDTWQPEGALVRGVRTRPFCVLLLDEVEKAHPSVLNLLLQIFEDGRLTDASGQTANFTHSVVIMTSNLGARMRPPVRFGEVGEAERAQDTDRAVREFFPPELFNRIDRVVHFQHLAPAACERIVEKELSSMLSRRGLTARGVFVSAAPGLASHVASRAFDREMGARPLKRWLEENVGRVLVDSLVGAAPAPMRLARLRVESGELALDLRALRPRDPAPGTFALVPLLDLGLAQLREQLAVELERLEEALRGDAAARIGDAIRDHLAGLQRGEPHRAEELSALDGLRERAESTRARLEELSLPGGRDDLEMLEVERFGTIDRTFGDGEERVRLFDRRAMRPSSAGTASREAMLDAFASSCFLRRILAETDEPSRRSVTVELLTVGTPSYWSQLIALLTTAYLRAPVELESFCARAWRAGELHSGGIKELKQLLDQRLGLLHVALRISGFGARSFWEGEEGLHVLESPVRLPDLVRVRLLDGSTSLEELVKGQPARVVEYEAARARGEAVGDGPDAPSPLVRTYAQVGAIRPGAEPSEIEDYAIPWACSGRAGHPVALLPELWRVWLSQDPSAPQPGPGADRGRP